jgi:hypothetical protein
MGEDGELLFGDSHPADFTRQAGEISHFGAGPQLLSADVNAHGRLAARYERSSTRRHATGRGTPRPFVDQTSAAPLAITSDSHTRDSTQGRRRMRGE